MKDLQNGRSMIEMLGVLAIIGVLSIGGLAGYTMAMNRHRANQVLDYVSRCVVVAQTSGDGSTIKEENCADILDEDKPAALTTDATITAGNNSDDITVSYATTDKVAEAMVNRSTDNITITSTAITFKGAGLGKPASADSGS